MRGMITALMLWAAVAVGQAPTYSVNQYASMGDVLDLGTNDFTVSAWVKLTGSGHQAIAGKGILTGTATPKGYGIMMSDAEVARVELRNGGTLYDLVGTTLINDGEWHHVVGVCDRDETDGLRVYVDGVLENSTNPTGADGVDFQCSHHFAVGARDWSSSGSFSFYANGSIDDVRPYSTALTSNQVARLTLDTCEMYEPTLWTNAALHAAAETWDTGYGNTNLAGAWRGDRTPYGNGETIQEVRDVSGSDNHGTLEPTQTTGPTWMGEVDGRRGVYEFDGSDDAIYITDHASLDIATALTLSAWVKSTDIDYNYALTKWGNTAWEASYHLRIDSDGKAYFTTSTSGSYQAARDVKGTSNLLDGNWHHIVGTYNGSACLVYVDGIQEGSGSMSGSLYDNSINVCVGGLGDGSVQGNWMDGYIADPKIYDSTLTSNQVHNLYLGTAPTNVPVLNMPFTYKDDQLPDLSGNGNDGVIYNAPNIEAAR